MLVHVLGAVSEEQRKESTTSTSVVQQFGDLLPCESCPGIWAISSGLISAGILERLTHKTVQVLMPTPMRSWWRRAASCCATRHSELLALSELNRVVPRGCIVWLPHEAGLASASNFLAFMGGLCDACVPVNGLKATSMKLCRSWMLFNHHAVGRGDDGRLARLCHLARPVPVRSIGPCAYILCPSVLRGGKLQKVGHSPASRAPSGFVSKFRARCRWRCKWLLALQMVRRY